MIPLLIKYWRDIALVIVIGLIFWLGWHQHTLADKAAEVDALKAQMKANEERYAALQKQSQATETQRAKDQLSIEQITNQMRLNDEKKHVVCSYGATDMRLLKAATSRHSVSR